MALRLAQTRNAARSAGLKQKRTYTTAPVFLSNLGPANVSSTKSGVRVVSEDPVGGTKGAASVQLWVKAGSIFEAAPTNGVASLLVRLGVNAKAPQLAKLGAKLHGGVCREYSVYKAECLPKDAPAVFQTFAEIAQGINFSDEAISAERKLLATQAESLVDTWNQSTLMDHFLAAAYQATPFERSPLGETKAIKGLDRNALNAFRTANYTGANMVLSVVGADASSAESAFASVTAGQAVIERPERIDVTGSQMNIRDDTVHEAQVLLGYETVGYPHKHWAALQVLQSLFGSWKKSSSLDNNASSRLAEIIATENLADSFSTFNKQFLNSGVFGVYASTRNEDRLDDLVYEIFNEYQKICQFLYEGDMTRAKAQITSQYLASVSSPSEQARDAANQVISFGRRMEPSEVIARISDVTVADVQEVVDTYMNDADPIAVAHGPLEEMPDYGILRSWTYWNRR